MSTNGDFYFARMRQLADANLMTVCIGGGTHILWADLIRTGGDGICAECNQVIHVPAPDETEPE